MITLVDVNHFNNTLSFNGLTTDTKPTDEYNGWKVTNSSTFLEMDSSSMYIFDEEHKKWIPM